MITYQITHVTTYTYTEPVSLCQNVARVIPRDCDSQTCEQTALSIVPEPAVIDQTNDYFGNPVTYFSIQEPHKLLRIEAVHEVNLGDRFTPDASRTVPWDRLDLRNPDGLHAVQYRFDSRYVKAAPEYAEYSRSSFAPGRPILDASFELTQRIFQDFKYDPRATTVATPTKDVFRTRRGVCQDFAHFQLTCLRSLGIPARYVSGYLSTIPPPGQERLIGADASHAWVSVYCGPDGWVDLDPTNNRFLTDKHIVLAWGRDYDDVSPVKGVILGGGQHKVAVSVDARPVPMA